MRLLRGFSKFSQGRTWAWIVGQACLKLGREGDFGLCRGRSKCDVF